MTLVKYGLVGLHAVICQLFENSFGCTGRFARRVQILDAGLTADGHAALAAELHADGEPGARSFHRADARGH